MDDMMLAVVCKVTWRPRLGNVELGAPQVEEMQLMVDRHAYENNDDPYTNTFYDLWAEATMTIAGRHDTNRNFFQIIRIEPVCSCLGPCRFPERERFWMKADGVAFWEAGLFDREEDPQGLQPQAFACGTPGDMALVLAAKRRRHHHQ
jgi:hypothetical protein